MSKNLERTIILIRMNFWKTLSTTFNTLFDWSLKHWRETLIKGVSLL